MASGGAFDALLTLKEGIKKPETGKALKDTKETVSQTARQTLQEIARLKDEFLKDPEAKKAVLGMAAAGLMAWVLMPEVKEQESKKDSQKKEDKETLQAISTKKSADEMPKLATISPKAKPEEILAAVSTNAATLDQLYKEYKNSNSKDSTKLRYFLTKAIIAKESGYKTPPEVAARLINVHAVTPKKVEAFRKRGIEFKMPNSSRELLPNKSFIEDGFEAFKNRVCSQLQPNATEPARTNNTAEILMHSAIGMGQVLPIYYLDGIKNGDGEKRLRIIFDFIKNWQSKVDGQEAVTARTVDRLGKRYDWNPMCIAAAYYGGTGAGDTMQKAPKSGSLSREQAYGYGSIDTYGRRVYALVEKIIEDQKTT